jgi:hypothetical protein
MCNCHHSVSCSDCSHTLRRDFLRNCGAAAATGSLVPRLVTADEAGHEQARVAVVFLGGSSGKESWPFPGFDCEGRHREVLKLLNEGCPHITFAPVVVGKPGEVEKAIEQGRQIVSGHNPGTWPGRAIHATSCSSRRRNW